MCVCVFVRVCAHIFAQTEREKNRYTIMYEKERVLKSEVRGGEYV